MSSRRPWPSDSWRTVASIAAVVLLALVGLRFLPPNGGCAQTKPQPPGPDETARFRKQSEDFLSHATAADDFCAQARPPAVAQAMRRGGAKVPASLPFAATVTLKDRTDHAGTEVAVFVDYDPRDLDANLPGKRLVIRLPSGGQRGNPWLGPVTVACACLAAALGAAREETKQSCVKAPPLDRAS